LINKFTSTKKQLKLQRESRFSIAVTVAVSSCLLILWKIADASTVGVMDTRELAQGCGLFFKTLDKVIRFAAFSFRTKHSKHMNENRDSHFSYTQVIIHHNRKAYYKF